MFGRVRVLLNHCVQIWNERRPAQHAAALAYYSMFAFAPILYVVLRIAGRVLSEPVVTETVQTILVKTLGVEVAVYVKDLVGNTAMGAVGGSMLTTIISMGALLYAATSFFVHLRRTLNSIWETQAPDTGAVRGFLIGRLLSFAMVIGLGAMLVVAVFAGAMVTLLQNLLGISTRYQLLFTTILFGLGTGTVAVIFRMLPTATVKWHHCLAGGAVTTLLVAVGGAVMLVYLRVSDVGNAFEAAGSLAVLLIGAYYSAQLFLAGAVFTRALGERDG